MTPQFKETSVPHPDAPTCALDGCEKKTKRDTSKKGSENGGFSLHCSVTCSGLSRRKPRSLCACGCGEECKLARHKYLNKEHEFKHRTETKQYQNQGKILGSKKPKRAKTKSTNFALKTTSEFQVVEDYRKDAYRGMPDLSLDYDVVDTSPNQDYYSQIDANMNGAK